MKHLPVIFKRKLKRTFSSIMVSESVNRPSRRNYRWHASDTFLWLFNSMQTFCTCSDPEHTYQFSSAVCPSAWTNAPLSFCQGETSDKSNKIKQFHFVHRDVEVLINIFSWKDSFVFLWQTVNERISPPSLFSLRQWRRRKRGREK